MNQDNGKEGSFADMLEESLARPRALEPGRQVEAKVVRIGKEWIFLDVGGKSEGVLAASEVLDKDGNLAIREGDRLKAYFLSARGSELLFTTKLGGATAHAHLEEAYSAGIPVEGHVEKEIKGGFEVRVAGARAFCPFSQMELRRVTDPAEYVGRTMEFRIMEFKEGGRNIILSRRALLEEERQQAKEKLKESLAVGQIVKGTITSIRDFGAFVDVGGIEGLIPVSEISWGRVEDIRGLLSEGQEVEVAIAGLDWEKERFSFSLKETLPDPWQEARARFPEGSVHTGTVARLATFGAFVNLAPGIDGLVHISVLGGGRRINHPREVVQEGDAIEVRVDAVDEEKKRISLVPAAAAAAAEKEAKPGKPKRDDSQDEYRQYLKTAKKETGRAMGTLGDLLQSKMKEKKKK
ncbi:MAG: 30S ribosomal protein S1 [Desulfobacteraceae bacterium]|nr:30S ribosomal protein S1 [Desulfobacteraceae bacterium]